MRFLLINTGRSYGFFALRKIPRLNSPHAPPLGLLYLAKSLEDEGHSTEILEYFAEKNPNEKIKNSLNSTDAVGLTVTSYPYKVASQCTKFIKEIDPSLPIIIGGPHCTFHPKKSLKDVPDADISVQGDGENTIKDIVRVFEGSKKLNEVAGIYYKKNNKIDAGKPPELIKDLDSISFPSRHLVEKYEYGKINNSFLFQPKLTSIITTRGCPFECRFCPKNAPLYSTFRQRSAENVVQEIQEIDDRYSSVMIVDDNFITDRKRANRIMDRLIEIGTTVDLLVYGTRVDSADRELFKKMKKAGVKYIGFGIESGNQETLDFYNKNIYLHQIKESVDLADEMDFITTGNFIIGAPFEEESHINTTIKFACSLPLDIVLFHPLYYMYGSKLWDEAVACGKINEDDGYTFPADQQSGLAYFSKETYEKYCRFATKRFYLRPSYIIRELFKAFRTHDFKLIKTEISMI
ncbi:MAG: B12-binding domain-containing radical SAM protein [Promethearchaeota archaeon]